MFKRPGEVKSGPDGPLISPPTSPSTNSDSGGAEIPDIPFKKPAMLLDRILAGKYDFMAPLSKRNGHKLKRGQLKRENSLPDIPHQSIMVKNAGKPLLSMRSAASLNSSHSSVPLKDRRLPALQTRGLEDTNGYEPLTIEQLSPGSFDLVAPSGNHQPVQFSLERLSDFIFSKRHLEIIFQDFTTLQRFTGFLFNSRPKSIPLLEYYLDGMKALVAIKYANALSGDLKPTAYYGSGLKFTETRAPSASNPALEEKVQQAFEVLATEDLPAFVTYVWMDIVETSMRRRITGSLPAHLKVLSDGLAETFCLTDPSKLDNPIIFASEEFHRTTQYGTRYAIGRNCRFLQGPKTNKSSIKRIREKLDAGLEHFETFLNYRRDGSPFMNLLMMAPLMDRTGKVRYFLGAQVDVSGLANDLAGLEYLRGMASDNGPGHEHHGTNGHNLNGNANGLKRGQVEEFRNLSEMFNLEELDIVRNYGGHMHRPDVQLVPERAMSRMIIFPDEDEDKDHGTGRDRSNSSGSVSFRLNGIAEETQQEPRPPSIADSAECSTPQSLHFGGNLGGIYEHYILVRPAPSLRILFASPSLHIPGLLQSNLMDRIGGSPRVRDQVALAFSEGRSVTANIRWIASPSRMPVMAHNNGQEAHGRPRWIHATPLLSGTGNVGVWMVVIVDDESDLLAQRQQGLSNRPNGTAPVIGNARSTTGGWEEIDDFLER